MERGVAFGARIQYMLYSLLTFDGQKDVSMSVEDQVQYLQAIATHLPLILSQSPRSELAIGTYYDMQT